MRTMQSILLATDFRQSSQEAAQAAVQLSSAFGSRVTVFHVLEQTPTWPETPQQNQERLLNQLAAENVDVADLLIGVGPPADTIVAKARELDVDLLLIGTGEKVRHEHLFIGPVTEAILEQAEQPVLAVHPLGPKLEFKTILCPVDHSRVSRRGLENAVRLAQAFAGKVIVLSVVPEVSWLRAAAETRQLAGAKVEHEAKWIEEFDEFLAKVSFGSVQWHREVRKGSPHEEIRAAAAEHRADLIVMGATGRTGLVRVLLGGVTRRLLKQLPCSLLTVKEEGMFDERFEENVEVMRLLMAEARELLASKSYPAAAARFRQVLVRNPFHVPALEGLAQACEELGQDQDARKCRDRSQRLKEESKQA